MTPPHLKEFVLTAGSTSRWYCSSAFTDGALVMQPAGVAEWQATFRGQWGSAANDEECPPGSCLCIDLGGMLLNCRRAGDPPTKALRCARVGDEFRDPLMCTQKSAGRHRSRNTSRRTDAAERHRRDGADKRRRGDGEPRSSPTRPRLPQRLLTPPEDDLWFLLRGKRVKFRDMLWVTPKGRPLIAAVECEVRDVLRLRGIVKVRCGTGKSAPSEWLTTGSPRIRGIVAHND